MIGFLKMGIGHYIAHLYPYLKKDYKLSVISYTHGALGDKLIIDDEIIKEYVKNYKLVINPHGFKETFQSTNELFEIFAKESFDVLNLHVSAYTRLTSYIFIPVIEYFKSKRTKILYTIHDVIPFPEGGRVSAYLEYFYRLADAAIVGNKQEMEKLKKLFHFEGKIFVATHGIYNLFNRNRLNQSEARETLDLKKGQNAMLFFGILRENKGLEDLIKAIYLLNQQGFKNVFLIIVLSLRSNISFDRYNKLIKQNQLNSQIKIIIKDSSTIQEIEMYFKAADLVVLPYTAASQSGILNLALAFEKPTIISNLFAETPYVNKKMGFVVDPKNPKMLAEKIKDFFRNKNALTKKFQANIFSYNKLHGFEQTATVYRLAFKSLLTPDEQKT